MRTALAIRNSINVLLIVIGMCSLAEVEDPNDFFFQRGFYYKFILRVLSRPGERTEAVEIGSEEAIGSGVLGLGDLLGQHVMCKLAILQLHPVGFLYCARIARNRA
jgi:hypothetical protein